MTAAQKKITANAAESIEAAMGAGKETIETAVKAGADAFKGYEDAVAYSKANVDAVMKANAIFVKGFQDINKVLFGLAQESIEDNVAASKKFLGCKTVQDVVEIQTSLASSNYAKVLKDGGKITDMSVKLAEESGQPIAKRVNETVEKITKPIAA
ncbi:MAG: phasin family protein [Proteobacteria bacterium]|nr:phasin family protein [Pseudomonadota bacterium]